MNPVFNFPYMNMNYHIEHHMFPMVPFHALPRLHALIRDQCPPPYANLRAAYAEIIPALLRQRRDPSWSWSGRCPPAPATIPSPPRCHRNYEQFPLNRAANDSKIETLDRS